MNERTFADANELMEQRSKDAGRKFSYKPLVWRQGKDFLGMLLQHATLTLKLKELSSPASDKFPNKSQKMQLIT